MRGLELRKTRSKYRGTKIEHGADDCARPYDVGQHTKLQAPLREAPPQRKGSSLSNRFQLLNVDGEESEDDDQVIPGDQTKNGFR
jgi:hypothetical protein